MEIGFNPLDTRGLCAENSLGISRKKTLNSFRFKQVHKKRKKQKSNEGKNTGDRASERHIGRS